MKNGSFNKDIEEEKTVKNLIQKFNIQCCIETGTYTGCTTEWFAKLLKQVFTVEITDKWYSYSLNKYFKPDDINKEIELQKQLVRYYSANPSQIVLIHNESSKGTFELKNIKSNNNIYITKESDIYNNLFLYTKIISEANEIHCLDSSFLHLVERTKTNAKLYFHDLFGASVRLSKNWYYVRYEH